MSTTEFCFHRLTNILRQVRKIKRNRDNNFYAVAVGRRIGIYRSWPMCKIQVDGIANAKFRRFEDREDALKYLMKIPAESLIPVNDTPRPDGQIREAEVYTDGSCWRNGLPGAVAAIGVYWPQHEAINTSKLIEGRQTSVRAELRAVIYALEQAKHYQIDCLTVYTDSDFVIQTALKWVWNWQKNDWKAASGREVKNKNDIIDLFLAIRNIPKVIWKSVPAHTGVLGNEAADKLANEAIAEYRRTTLCVEDKTFQETFDIEPLNKIVVEDTNAEIPKKGRKKVQTSVGDI